MAIEIYQTETETCDCQPGILCPPCLSEWLDYCANLDKLEADLAEEQMAQFKAVLESEENDYIPAYVAPEYTEADEKAASKISAARGW